MAEQQAQDSVAQYVVGLTQSKVERKQSRPLLTIALVRGERTPAKSVASTDLVAGVASPALWLKIAGGAIGQLSAIGPSGAAGWFPASSAVASTLGRLSLFARMRCMFLPADLAVGQLDCAKARVLALCIGALLSVEAQAQCLVAALGGQIRHCCGMRCLLRILELVLDHACVAFLCRPYLCLCLRLRLCFL